MILVQPHSSHDMILVQPHSSHDVLSNCVGREKDFFYFLAIVAATLQWKIHRKHGQQNLQAWRHVSSFNNANVNFNCSSSGVLEGF